VKVAKGVIATSELYKKTMMLNSACIAPDYIPARQDAEETGSQHQVPHQPGQPAQERVEEQLCTGVR
jgi:hypothetical protein